MRPKGLRDIKTYSTLGRSRLVKGLGGTILLATAHSSRDRFLEHFEQKIRLHQIEVIRDLLEEFHQALAEGLPVALDELERVQAKLRELQSGFLAGR